MSLSSDLMKDLVRRGLVKAAATAPVATDPSGMPAQAPQPMQDPNMAMPPQDPNAMAMPADPNAMAAQAMPMDPNAMPMDPNMMASILSGMAPQGQPGTAVPAMPPPEDTPPVDSDTEKNTEALKKAIEELTDRIQALDDRIKGFENERSTEKEYSALEDLVNPPKVAPADEPEAAERGSIFSKLAHKVFKK